MRMLFNSTTAFLLFFLFTSCGERKASTTASENPGPGTFAYDVAFMKAHKEVLMLGSKNGAKVLIVGDYQARVMTSTADGDQGNSYGWINYNFIAANEIRKHMNAYGGEDRFWLGPEGGQYAIFFK